MALGALAGRINFFKKKGRLRGKGKVGKNWIAGAIEKPGSFKASAKRAGESTMEYAREKKSAGGLLGKRARLALTLSKLRKRKG